jgi:hypothetical protein
MQIGGKSKKKGKFGLAAPNSQLSLSKRYQYFL